MPLTLRASKLEYDSWTERNLELQNALESDEEEMSLACWIRWHLIESFSF